MKLIVLDRDGVINQDSDAFIKSPQEWQPIDGSIASISRLYQHGYTIFVATNQSGLARGLFQPEDLDAIHAKMHALVEVAGGKIEQVFFCPHGPDDNCQCRKPRAGLLDQIENYCATSLQGAPCIGDSLRDLQAANSKGCQPILVLTGKGEKTREELGDLQPLVFTNLAAATDAIIRSTPAKQ